MSANLSAGADEPDDPSSIEDPPSSIGPTATMPAPGPTCDECGKANHIGVSQCVFCGHPLKTGSASGPVFTSPQTEPAKGGWAEGPESGEQAVRQSEPPPSRRASMLPSFDDLGAGARPIADPLIGVVVADRYRILEPLGRGGMGAVYKVEHTRIGKLLAMKLLTGELSRNPDVVRRFKTEALTVSKLSSPNTVQVFDFGAAEGLTYLVMELIAGEDLGRALRTKGPMPFERLGKIIIQVCSSLTEAHQEGIVHRDVKPENIMLLHGRDGTDVAKVLDFGLAKLRESSDLNDVTSQGAIVGTPYFMAPEQVRGEAVDARCDIYALGALMYRALTGHYPFNGPTPMAVFTKHLTETPQALTERAPELGIPLGANAIVLKALEKNPADRWQKVEDLQNALLEQMKAAGSSSLDTLLDSGQVRRLAKVAAEVEMKSTYGASAVNVELATRDELLQYERKLRQKRYTAVGFAVVGLLAVVGVGVRVYATHKPAFAGHEVEPNDNASEALLVPFGEVVTGTIGKRIDATHGDRDFYAYDVPRVVSNDRPTTAVHLKVTALPNFATCTMLYRQGLSSALAQYCVGRPARDLDIPRLDLEPGRYFVAVMQDLDGYGGPPPYLHENVSDTYSVMLEAAATGTSAEIEPNDQVASANFVTLGMAASGRIGWARDEDVWCVGSDVKGAVRWKIADAVRDAASVLEVTPLRGTEEQPLVRVHVSGNGPIGSTDVMSPWISAPVAPDGASRCVRLRLALDPWGGQDGARVPSGGIEPYAIEVVAVP